VIYRLAPITRRVPPSAARPADASIPPRNRAAPRKQARWPVVPPPLSLSLSLFVYFRSNVACPNLLSLPPHARDTALLLESALNLRSRVTALEINERLIARRAYPSCELFCEFQPLSIVSLTRALIDRSSDLIDAFFQRGVFIVSRCAHLTCPVAGRVNAARNTERR